MCNANDECFVDLSRGKIFVRKKSPQFKCPQTFFRKYILLPPVNGVE